MQGGGENLVEWSDGRLVSLKILCMIELYVAKVNKRLVTSL